MKNRAFIYLIALLPFLGKTQNNTFSPYSRYGLGELAQTDFAHNSGMGGARIAWKPDSTMPVFLNVGNPASYALIRLTALEVGGNFVYSQFKGNNNSNLTKWTTNFSYGALGFPVKGNGGACFGIMPYTSVGYKTENTVAEDNIGNVTYKFAGDGGLNKAFIGYGIMPFNHRYVKFRSKHYYLPDSLKTITHQQYMRREKLNKLVSDLSIGFNVNYIFGNINNSARVLYPNSGIYNYTYRERVLTMGDFTGNFGLQTGLTIDSVRSSKGHKRALKEKFKITFGYFMSLNNAMKANYNTGVYGYVLNGSGQEIIRDTVLYKVNQNGTIKLPMEQGFGIGMKKGERLNIVADFAITDWENFKYLNEVSDFKNNYRVAAGMNFVPDKYAAGRGAFLRRINYRLGVSYQTGYINVKNSLISDYNVSVGVGLPVGIGRLSSMINISAQYGQMGSPDPSLIKQDYWRVGFGFTFCDRWFQKYREN